MEMGLGRGHIVLDGGPAPLPIKGAERPPAQFSAHFIVAKRLDASRCQLVWRSASAQATLCSMRTQISPEKRVHPPHPICGPRLLWPNGWMDEDATWCGSTSRPRPHCIRRGSQLSAKGAPHSSPRVFSAHVYCCHGRPSQILLSSCISFQTWFHVKTKH